MKEKWRRQWCTGQQEPSAVSGLMEKGKDVGGRAAPTVRHNFFFFLTVDLTSVIPGLPPVFEEPESDDESTETEA